MAKVTDTKTTVTSLTLELSLEEAKALKTLIYSSVGGNPDGRRRLFDDISEALSEYVEPYSIDEFYLGITRVVMVK